VANLSRAADDSRVGSISLDQFQERLLPTGVIALRYDGCKMNMTVRASVVIAVRSKATTDEVDRSFRDLGFL